ncbi:MAG: NADH-quinone oxidoreductase subunit NuoH [Armatimonadota bacterium]
MICLAITTLDELARRIAAACTAAGVQLQPGEVTRIGQTLLAAFIIVLVLVPITALVLIYLERKISGHIQDRLGPMRAGPKGILQTILDAVKLLLKEDIIPKDADQRLFTLAPILVFCPAAIVLVTLPFGNGVWAADLNLGIVFIAAFSGLTVLGIILAGFASNNKWSLLGALRGAAQLISYEIPMGLAIVAAVIMAGDMKMSSIVQAQENHWFIWRYPGIGLLSFLIYFTAGTAEVNRIPFDIPEAESELVAGFHTEYSGMKFALFFLAEYVNMFVVCGVGVTLFFGGWQLPFAGWIEHQAPAIGGIVNHPAASVVWFFAKVYALIVVMMWIRWTYPRLRVDQLMAFCWKLLIPLGFINLFLAAIWIVVFERVPS